MNGTVMVTSLMMGGQKSPAPSPPCTAMDLGGGCPVLQVCLHTPSLFTPLKFAGLLFLRGPCVAVRKRLSCNTSLTSIYCLSPCML